MPRRQQLGLFQQGDDLPLFADRPRTSKYQGGRLTPEQQARLRRLIRKRKARR